jgi:hypothetical protein
MRNPELIIITAIVSAVLLGLQHYLVLPYWKAAARREMPLIVRYIGGVLSTSVPTCFLFIYWGSLTAADAITAIVCNTVLSGLSVVSFYALDWLFELISLWHDRRTAKP